MSVRVGVIGTGWFGRKIAMALAGIREANLVGVTNRTFYRAERVAAELGTAAYPTVAELLDEGRPELVVVATADDNHLAASVQSLEAGCHVLVEKPLATTSAEAHAIAAAAKKADRFLAVAHVLRFDEAHIELAKRIHAGELGDIRYVYARRNLPVAMHTQASKLHPAVTAMPHDIDLLRWFLGSDPRKVTAHEAPAAGSDVLVAALEFDSALAVVESCWLLPDTAPFDDALALSVVGTEGSAAIRVPSSAMQLITQSGLELVNSSYWPESDGVVRGALREELAYMVACVADDRKPERLPLPDAIATVETMERILQSLEEGRQSR